MMMMKKKASRSNGMPKTMSAVFLSHASNESIELKLPSIRGA